MSTSNNWGVRKPARNKEREARRLQGSAVRVLREQLGLTQSLFGEKYNLSQRQVSHIETGEQSIPENAKSLRNKLRRQFELSV